MCSFFLYYFYMKSLSNIIEGFFDNIGTSSPASWVKNIEYKTPDNMFHGERWAKEYTYKKSGAKLTLMYNGYRFVIDFEKGMLWERLVKYCNPNDYAFRFEPSGGDIHFRLWNKKQRQNEPSVHIIFHKNLEIYEMKIEHREMLDIDDKFYKSKGYCTGGFNTGEYIQNKEMIKTFVG